MVAGVVFGANGLAVYGSVSYQFDPQGNVAHLLNDNGYADGHCAYDAWGQLMAGTNSTPYGYKAQWGYYTDSETGLLLLTHRYLNPTTGRFLTRDPIGYEGSINLYAYVGNGVVVMRDPLGQGLANWDDCFKECKNLLRIILPRKQLRECCEWACSRIFKKPKPEPKPQPPQPEPKPPGDEMPKCPEGQAPYSITCEKGALKGCRFPNEYVCCLPDGRPYVGPDASLCNPPQEPGSRTPTCVSRR